MTEKSALSPMVRAYLDTARSIPCIFARFLTTPDFKKMQEIAKDFGGLDIELPGGKYALTLNVFGVLTLEPKYGLIYAVTTQREAEDDAAYMTEVRAFIAGVRQYVYPSEGSVWCSEAIIQALYDSTTKRIEEATGKSLREE